MPDETSPAAAAVPLLAGGKHPDTYRRCPVCDQDLMRAALADLAYTFETCECAAATYTHLVEQLWHRRHLEAGGGSDV